MSRKVNAYYESLQDQEDVTPKWPDDAFLNDEGLYVFEDGTYLPDGVYSDDNGGMLIYEKLRMANLMDLVDKDATE